MVLAAGQIAVTRQVGRETPGECRAALSDLRQITVKPTLDIWNTLLALLFLGAAAVCLLHRQLAEAGGAAVLTALCFFSGGGQEVSMRFGADTVVRVLTGSREDADELVEHVAGRTEVPVAENRRARRAVQMLSVLLVAACVLVWAVRTFGGDNAVVNRGIKTVKNGYLGGYTDVTVETVMTDFFLTNEEVAPGDIDWSGGRNSRGETVVEIRYFVGGVFNRVRFILLSEDTFAFVWMEDPAVGIETTPVEDCMDVLNGIYLSYYTEMYGGAEAAERLEQVPRGAVLCGAGAGYTGERESLYQDVFGLEPGSETAADAPGLAAKQKKTDSGPAKSRAADCMVQRRAAAGGVQIPRIQVANWK